MSLCLPRTSPAPAGAPRRASALLWRIATAAWVVGYAALNATAGVRGTYELWWEARQGQLTLASGQAVLPHSWSWTAGASPWIPNSWGWGVLLAGAYRLGGLGGIVAFVFLAQICFFALAWWLFGLLGVRRDSRRSAVLVVLSLTMSGWASGRAEMADYFCIFGFAAVCLLPRTRAGGTSRRTLFLALAALLLTAVWENLHLGGLVAVAVFAAVFVICETVSPGRLEDGQPRRLLTRVVAIASGAALGVLATPSGFAGVMKSLDTAARSRAEHYAAWGHLFEQPRSYNYEPAVLALLVGAVALVMAVRARKPAAAVILCLVAVSTCVVVRSGSDLAMLGILTAAGIAATRERRREAVPTRSAKRTFVASAAVIAAGVWAVVSLVCAGFSATPLWRLTGVDPADLAGIPAGTRIYSTVSASDAIALLRPDLQVTIDSRNDLYPVRLYTFARSLSGAGAGRAAGWFAEHDVAVVYLPGAAAVHGASALASALSRAGWHEDPERHGLLMTGPGLASAPWAR
jgi:hypothetical protein